MDGGGHAGRGRARRRRRLAVLHSAGVAALDRPRTARDPFIDALRALSLLVVVVWHWVFTVIIWKPDGPHASNPIGVTRGLWLLTWLFQVLPVFFFAGGYVHARSWTSEGGGWRWVTNRLRALWMPALALVVLGVAVWFAAREIAPGAQWVGRGVVLMLSPLWFLVVYALLVTGMPLWTALHERYGELVPVWMVGAAVIVDVLRFRYDLPLVQWVNLVVVWALPHQLGFYYERFTAAPRRFSLALTSGGLIALFGLTNMGLYPRSMVGVPGEAISNMAPPTLAIAALTTFQVGVLLANRTRIQRWALTNGQRLVEFASRNSMRIFLWHAPGFAIAYGLWRLADLPGQSTVVDASWWAWRPVWLLLPIIPTAILANTIGRLTLPARRRTAEATGERRGE